MLVVAVVALVAITGAHADFATTTTDVGRPQQMHIAFRGKDYDMVVSWLTGVQTPSSTVKFGTASGKYTNVVNGSLATSYYKDNFVHHVVLEGLAPSTTYYYVCGSAESGFSNEYSFESPPTSSQRSFNVMVYGDMGISNSGPNLQQIIEHKDDVDFVYHIGDYAYADDRLTTKDYDETWNEWANEIVPVAAYKAYMAMPGNHEATCHSFGDFFCPDGLKNFSAYNARFRMPAEESGSGTNMWTSFEYGSAHFISIDTETDYDHAPEGVDTIFKAGGFGDQLAWLEADLKKAAANRAQRPWIIVGGHRPLYTASKPGLSSIIWPNTTGHLRAAVEDMFHQYNVDIYLCGHVHAYERHYPIYRNQYVKSYNNPTGLTGVVIGCAGNIEGHQNKWVDPIPGYCAVHNGDDYGYGILRVHNDTNLQWTFYTAGNSTIADDFMLYKEHSTAPALEMKPSLRGLQ